MEVYPCPSGWHTWDTSGPYLEHIFQASSDWSILARLNQHQRGTKSLGEVSFPEKTQKPKHVKGPQRMPGTVLSTSHS